MKTYQDLLKVKDNEKDRADFVRSVILDYKGSEAYRTAVDAFEYARCRNVTTMQYQKYITTLTGQKVLDTISAVHRSTSNFFKIFMTQLTQYLLANGVSWNEASTEKKLPKSFDKKLQKAGKFALIGGVAWGYYNPANKDPLIIFKATEYAPLVDEETGEYPAGVRFWQIAEGKPLRGQLFEADGVTSFLWTSSDSPSEAWIKLEDGVYYLPKQTYMTKIVGDKKDMEDGTYEVRPAEPLPGFPVIPLWANDSHQSELIGLQEKIDAYDFILNGWEDDLDNAQIFWIIKGAGGMTDPELAQFLDRLRTVGAVAPEAGQEVDATTVSLPVEAREKLLDRLERQLYKDAMVMNPSDIVGGANTATQIKAAYEPQNLKTDEFEYCVIDFCDNILALAEIDDEPTFTRSMILNTQEEVQTVISAAQFVGDDYATEKILTIMGDGDKADEIIKTKDADEITRIGNIEEEEPEEVIEGA